MSPQDVISAYKLPASAAANGKIVAVLDGPDSKAYADLTAYRAAYGLPAIPKCSGSPTGSLPACFAQVGENGGPSTGEDSGSDGDSETSLDMQMVSAACPDCSILLVEIGDTQGNFSDSDFVSGAKTAASLGAVATSISIGGAESGGSYGGDPTGYTTPGHLVLAAAGDFGYDLVNEGQGADSPSYPASAPDVLAVGGTMLFRSGSQYDEAVWNDGTFNTSQNGQDVTTSGCSTEFAAPSWQAAALSGSGCARRATADVSAAAAFTDGGQVIDIAVYQAGWQSVEGTSASSPMMAGILTRLGLAETISGDLGWPYSNPSGFNDLGSAAYPADPSGSTTDSNESGLLRQALHRRDGVGRSERARDAERQHARRPRGPAGGANAGGRRDWRELLERRGDYASGPRVGHRWRRNVGDGHGNGDDPWRNRHAPAGRGDAGCCLHRCRRLQLRHLRRTLRGRPRRLHRSVHRERRHLHVPHRLRVQLGLLLRKRRCCGGGDRVWRRPRLVRWVRDLVVE